MTEAEARDWICARYGQETQQRVNEFLAMVTAESARQNLVARSTLETLWSRHVLDSAQLEPLGNDGLWIDIGTGGGFPGMIVALLRADPVLMVEPRKLRAQFLEQCVTSLGLNNARIIAAKIETLTEVAPTISARAVASLQKLLQIGAHCAKEQTRWLLPRGQLEKADLVFLQRRWRGAFHVEQSLTDAGSSILVLDGQPR